MLFVMVKWVILQSSVGRVLISLSKAVSPKWSATPELQISQPAYAGSAGTKLILLGALGCTQQLDMGVAEFKSARRWKKKSHSPPRRSSSESNLVFPSEVT